MTADSLQEHAGLEIKWDTFARFLFVLFGLWELNFIPKGLKISARHVAISFDGSGTSSPEGWVDFTGSVLLLWKAYQIADLKQNRMASKCKTTESHTKQFMVPSLLIIAFERKIV